ncbi:MAG: GNAT family N-acetyltransferase [Oscillospiraceae bacterium]|nr:GNAT family N-acetyltransferase [Oscillospiraceae bacterium]
MFSFYLKRAAPDDFKYIYLINSRLFGDKCQSELKSRLIFEDIINNNKNIFLTVNHGNRVAGYAYAAEIFSMSFGHYAEVIDFITLEYYRSKGADEYLLRAVEQWASQTLCSEIRFCADDKIKEDLLKRLAYMKDENSQIYRKQL